jgi:ClpP class serine protease
MLYIFVGFVQRQRQIPANHIQAHRENMARGIDEKTMALQYLEALKALGIKRTYISAGEGKVAGNPAEPLDDASRRRMQSAVDDAFGMFVANVVKGRGAGMTAERVEKEWKAHVYGSREALALGMIDGVATLDETIARVIAGEPAVAAHALTSLPDTTQEPAAALAARVTVQDRGAAASRERQRQEAEALAI